MYIFRLADNLLRLVIPLAVCLTTYLYLYPVFHSCVFPTTDASTATAFTDTIKRHWAGLDDGQGTSTLYTAPFRLLALADPQLEGDSSLPKPEDALIPRLRGHWSTFRSQDSQDTVSCATVIAKEIATKNIPDALKGLRKRIDLFGNDYYLGHIFRTLHWWTKPTHVTVLGDLIGSQWVTNDEFDWRGWRYWNRAFAGGRRVEDSITTSDEEEKEKVFAMDDSSWTQRVINIAGNHDIGYAGDLSQARMERFESMFGKANWDVRFEYPHDNATLAEKVQPSLQLIVLNSMILDTPVLSDALRTETFDYLNNLISQRLRPVEDKSSFTLLLTHIPLHKEEGICVDSPFFDYWGDDDGGGVYKPHGLREQNHLSKQTSQQGTLQALFGLSGNADAPGQGKGRNGLILTGHDHEGCDTWHYIPSDTVWSASDQSHDAEQQTTFAAQKWETANHDASHTGIREITLRSMMGDYGGNAGLLSAWFDFEAGEWKYEIQRCGLNLKVWWAVHIIDLITLVLCLISIIHKTFFYTSPVSKVTTTSTKKNAPVQE